MKQLTVISGKGGTGKTTLTASFVSLVEKVIIADCDVDAPDLHLILNPKLKESIKFSGLKIAVRDYEKCNECGICREHCRFDAIDVHFNIQESCEGCGVCEYVCPENAIRMMERNSGEAFISDTRFGPMSHAKLNIGEEASGKLVTLVRNNAKLLAEKHCIDLIIIDGPPGIGCPVIAAISGVDLVLAVTEPTLAGIHDLKRIVSVAEHFSIPSAVCINKYDINIENTKKIEDYCSRNGLEILEKLPYDTVAVKAMIEGESVVEYYNGVLARKIEELWRKVEVRL